MRLRTEVQNIKLRFGENMTLRRAAALAYGRHLPGSSDKTSCPCFLIVRDEKLDCEALARRGRGGAQRVVRGTSAPDMHSILGFGIAEETRHAWDDTHHYSDTAADRRAAELGLFEWMGVLSGRWARHHSDHRYYFSPNGTNIETAKGKLKAQDRHFRRLKACEAAK